jgi:hypothetical protein
MAKRSFIVQAQTFTAQAYTANLSNATYAALKGGSGTQLSDILEVLVSGMATASTVAAMQLSRVSTLEAGAITALASPNSDGPMHPSTAALAAVPVSFVAAATNGPQASAVITDARLNFALNLFGGIVRWNAAPTQQFSILGNTADLGEAVLFNSSTGGGSSGLANAHIIYEPY